MRVIQPDGWDWEVAPGPEAADARVPSSAGAA